MENLQVISVATPPTDHRRRKELQRNIKYTYTEVKGYVLNLGYSLLSEEYNNSHQRLILRDSDGYYYLTSLTNLRSGRTGIKSKFSKNNPYIIQNINLWCNINNKPYKLISNNYDSPQKKLNWKCLKEGCGEVFEMNWINISQGQNCGYCSPSPKQAGLSNCLATLNPELASEWHPTKNGDLTPHNVTPNSQKKVWWKCKDDPKHEWRTFIKNRNSRKDGCPECSKSKGEKRIRKFFINNNFVEITQENYTNLNKDNNIAYFIPQKEFEGLVGLGNGLLSYDFYLPKFNLLIEYQGEFHDGKAKHQTNEGLKYQQEHDKRKKEYAISKGYNFLEIWYWDFDNIESILNEYIKSNPIPHTYNDKEIKIS